MSSLVFVDRDSRATVRIVALATAVALNAAALISLSLPAPPGALLLPALITEITAVVIDPPVVVPPPPLPEPPPLPMRPKPVRTPVTPTPPTTVAPTTSIDSVATLPVSDTPPSAVDATIDTTADAVTNAGAGSGAMQALAYARRAVLNYPVASLRNKEQGEVLLRVLVDANGIPERIEIARSSGYARLDRAARESVLGWTFRPVLQNGVATPAWGLVPVQFRLDQG